MTLLVDANVLCEPTKSNPNPRVVDWLLENEPMLAVDPVILGEIRFGIHCLPEGRRRQRLEAWFEAGIARIHCLPWEAATGLEWARLMADLRSRGRRMPVKDSFIAATALTHSLTLATRNRRNFEACGIEILDPFMPPETTA